MPLPFCREHPGMRVLQLSLWHRAAGVGLRSGGVFIVQVVYVMCEFSVAARAWQVPLHRALASPKPPLSSYMGLGCHPPPLPLSLQGKPTRGSRGWMQILGISKETPYSPKAQSWSCLILLCSSPCRGKPLRAAGAGSRCAQGLPTPSPIAVWGQKPFFFPGL